MSATARRVASPLDAASRQRLLDVLRAAGRPMPLTELAESCGLHANTARTHLDVLRGAGLVLRAAEQSARRGRPRMLFTAAPERSRSGYEQLAALLAAHWGDVDQDRALSAEQAGFAAATESHPAADPAPSPDDIPFDELVDTFAEMGFEPRLEVVEDGARLELHACPFRAVATEHPDVVCSLHLGLIRGLLSRRGAPPTETRLSAFVEPGLCVATIITAPRE